MKITKVYTRTGDKGTTALVGGDRVSKADKRIEAYGTIDELSSLLGLLAANMENTDDIKMLQRVQNTLFCVGTQLATNTETTQMPPSAIFSEEEIKMLEKEIDKIVGMLPQQMGFILPGGSQQAAMAHVARTVCRRAERRMVDMAAEQQVTTEALTFVNRLSDYLFVLAKKINSEKGLKEKYWQNTCK